MPPPTQQYNGNQLSLIGTSRGNGVYQQPGSGQFFVFAKHAQTGDWGLREESNGDVNFYPGYQPLGASAPLTPAAQAPIAGAIQSSATGVYAQPSTITSSSLNPPPAYPYQSTQPASAYPVATLGSTPGVSANGQMTLTPEEQKAQDYSTKLQDLNNQLLGQSSYRTEQENAQGLTSLNTTKQDLTSQLNALKNEAMAIPLQAQNQAEGRGVTAGGLRPVEAAATRNNAIQALTVNSLLEATNGNISTALQMVDRAVAQKYDPIKEQIEVAQKNLELILNSPQASIEDKNRALAQKAIQDAKADQLTQDRENWTNIQKVALDAAAAGADALTLNKIQNAKSPVEAASLAAAAGVYGAAGGDGFSLSPGQTRYDARGNVIAEAPTNTEDKVLSPSEAEKLGVPYGTTQAQAADMGITPKPATSNASIGPTKSEQYRNEGYKGITPDMTQAEADAAVAAQIKPSAPSGYPTVTMAPGSTDTANVKKLQDWLVANGYMTQADVNTGYGTYGPKTTAAVAKVQSQYGVDNTGAVGYWGPKTQAALTGGAPAPVTKPTATKTAPEYSFSATGSDKSKVLQYASANSGIDTNKLKTDEGYFYWILSQANADTGRDL
jgi:hypothetical protein